MTDDYYKDFALALEAAEDAYMKELYRRNPKDERGRTRKIFGSFKDYVNKLIAELSKFISRSKEAIMINIRKVAVKTDIARTLKQANSQYGKNTTGVKIACPDFARYAVEVRKASDKVWKYADHIVNKTYVDINQLDSDMAKFEIAFNEAWTDINAASKLKTAMTVEKFRELCKNELKGDSIISRTVADSIHKMEKARIEIDYMEKRRESMEVNRIIPHKLNILQRIMARIAKFCSGIWKGFLGMACFLTS